MNVAFILFVATEYKNITNFMFVSNISKKVYGYLVQGISNFCDVL